MDFFQQIWVLMKKDLLIVLWRRWLSTFIRALLLPVIYTVLIAEVKNWTAPHHNSNNSIGTPSAIRSLSDAFALTGNTRPNIAIIDNGFKDGDIGEVVQNLSAIVLSSGKTLHLLSDDSTLDSVCPSSNLGVSPCFGAIQFFESPDHGNKSWNYTLYADSALNAQSAALNSDQNDAQVYIFPLQRAVDNAIASTHGGSSLLETMQFPFTWQDKTVSESSNRDEFEETVISILGFAYFIGLAGIAFHLAGHVCSQREHNNLELIDAMMPNRSRWMCVLIRTIATHLAFDLIYLPGWIIMGVALPIIIFPHTGVGIFVALYILCGLAMISYSVLLSSMFRKAQISGGVAVIVAIGLSLVAQFAEGDTEKTTTAGVFALGLLFPPANFVYFLMQTASYEVVNQGLDVNKPASNDTWWQIPGSTFLSLLIFPILVYPLLAIITEKYLHIPSSKSRTLGNGNDMNGVAVKIRNFSKQYKDLKDKKKTITAVSDLTMDIHAGSITVLLGANGSGKSTTLNSISGTEKITNGTIEIDGTGGLGICPQKNVMWDLMTVEEHINFFESLKNPKQKSRAERRAEVDRLISGCDLVVKRNSLSKTLSGGQKRKLQLAMMLAGGSKVCCIDEASSGIDPIARRKVWDILLAERGERTLLFTTHFLDEAEGLADHVAILSKGLLKAQGSVASLKRKYGGAYQVILPSEERSASFPLPSQVTLSTDYSHPVYSAPNSSVLAELIATMERNGILNSRIEGPNIEKVFLKLAEEMQGDSDLARDLKLADEGDEHKESSPAVQLGKPRNLDLDTGRGVTPVRQTWILFKKRVTILKHNYMPYVAVLVFSLLVAGLITRFFTPPSDVPAHGLKCEENNLEHYVPYTVHAEASSFSSYSFVWGPPNRLTVNQLQRAIPNNSESNTYNVTTSPTVNSYQEFKNYIEANSASLWSGGFFDGTDYPSFAWINEGSIDAAALLSVIDGVLMNQTLNWGFQNFKEPYIPEDGITSLVSTFAILGFSIYPGFFALYPTAERIRKVRAMHYSNGIRSLPVWLSHALFDFCFVIVISVITIIVWQSQWAGWYAPGYLFVVLFLYGLAATAFSYVVSLFASSQLAAFALTSVIQVIIAILYWLGYVISAENSAYNMRFTYFNYIHYTIALISPAASLERALIVSLNEYSIACRGTQLASYPGEISLYGAPILYLIIQFIVLVMFLVFWESGGSLESLGIKRKLTKKQQEDIERAARLRPQEVDATEDTLHLSSENKGLRVINISKSFGKKVAVENATFGILPSEKFALLGPNGAGKSTVISLVRRELRPDSGSKGSSIDIGGDNLQYAPIAALNHLGVCPQFDAVDTMTLLDHLYFYAAARGVPNPDKNVNELITRFGLEEHKHKLARKLSGGTKRKLSLAIALIANPSVLLLDEPSSGMDPAAKRALWSTLSAISQGRVLLMTTHSMEEADALCDRAGIIASRLLALGSIEELRQRHGHATFVHLVHKDAPYTNSEDSRKLESWVHQTFPDAVIERRNFAGQMRFSIPRSAEVAAASGLAVGKLFRMVESVKEDMGVADYSIGPATLDQVFLNVVGKHLGSDDGFREENTEKQRLTAKQAIRTIFR